MTTVLVIEETMRKTIGLTNATEEAETRIVGKVLVAVIVARHPKEKNRGIIRRSRRREMTREVVRIVEINRAGTRIKVGINRAGMRIEVVINRVGTKDDVTILATTTIGNQKQKKTFARRQRV